MTLTFLPTQNDPYRPRKSQLALSYSGAMESMPHRIWNKLKAIIPHRSRDTVSPQAVVGDSNDLTIDDEDASAEPSVRAFYADGPSAGHDITTVAFSRDLSRPGIISHPVFVVRNLDRTTEDENASFRSDVDLNSSGLGYGVGSTSATLSQDLSEPRISTYPALPHHEQGSQWSTAFGLTNYQDSGSRQSADYSISAPMRKGTPPLLSGYQSIRSRDNNLAGLYNFETTAPTNAFPTTRHVQSMPIAPSPVRALLPRFDTLLMIIKLRFFESQLIKKS